jgi:hypothetical protein
MSKWFSITYHPYVFEDLKTGKRFEIFRPTIPIVIVYKNKPSWDFQALVDSGSDRNLFPAKIGESIGIDIKKGKHRPIRGIGDYEIAAYTHKIKIMTAGKIFDTEVDFSYEQEAPLLGRNGFFDFFKEISFDEKVKKITFKP